VAAARRDNRSPAALSRVKPASLFEAAHIEGLGLAPHCFLIELVDFRDQLVCKAAPAERSIFVAA
jgi:hypothetical protein